MTLTKKDLRPVIDGHDEFVLSKENRKAATKLAYDTSTRPALHVEANPEELENEDYPISNFTKGLPHTVHGNVGPHAHKTFVRALRMPHDLSQNGGFPAPLGLKGAGPNHPFGYDQSTDVVQGEAPVTDYFHEVVDKNDNHEKPNIRKWESPLGGLNSDITGPAVGGLSLPPAPSVGSSELCAEIAEVYAMALLRDTAFSDLVKPNTPVKIDADTTTTVGAIQQELAKLNWFNPLGDPVSSERTQTGSFKKTLSKQETRRREARWDENGEFSLKSFLRGSSGGAKSGPYLSQFLLQGSGDAPARLMQDPNSDDPQNTVQVEGQASGQIKFGTQIIDQLNQPDPKVDFLTNWFEWLDVQNGALHKGNQSGVKPKPRFLTTLRDMAAYVHVDQLYQAYFNAALLILPDDGEKVVATFDLSIPNNKVMRNTTREGFATWGGPHLLDLLASVSSRALKVVRRQKFQIHRRARPEVLAARLALALNDKSNLMGKGGAKLDAMVAELQRDCPSLLNWLSLKNAVNASSVDSRGLAVVGDVSTNPIDDTKNILLPMAFPEGSPMHPAYGAGHATVAGACVTVLKALLHTVKEDGSPVLMSDIGFANIFEGASGRLTNYADPTGLTVTGELEKLAANISIARNMAGVHYYTDYFESLRVGERIAVSILQEHLQTSPEPIRLCLKDFDGRDVEIKKGVDAESRDEAIVVIEGSGSSNSHAEWWQENVAEYETGIV